MGAGRTSQRNCMIQRLERLRKEIVMLYLDNPVICQHNAEHVTRVTKNTRESQRIAGLRLENGAV